jgi:hypothetical protein
MQEQIGITSDSIWHGSISTTLNIYTHVLHEHMEQFERQRARILGDGLLEFDGMRPHQVHLEGGDASSDSYCFAGGAS